MIEVVFLVNLVKNQKKEDNMSFFEGLGYTIEAVGEFFGFIPKAIAYLVEVMSYMPINITLYMMATITCTAVLLILGRN
jgi:hypothetical protein